MWDHFYWRFLNGQNPDDGQPLFDGTGTGADGITRGKLSREDIDNRIGAAGMWWDPHLGIYHVRHRAYDPRLGRFLQPDPIGVAGGWNVFEYVGGDPANFVDPMGLQRVPPGWPADPNGALFGIERGFRQEREAAFAWGRDLAGHVKIATETGVTVAAVGAIVILPGPEDVVLAAAMSRHGIAALKIVGDKLIGIMKGGDEIELVGKTADEVGDAVRKDGAVGHPARVDAKSPDEAATCKAPADQAVDAGSSKKKSPNELGNEGEQAVAQILGLPKNTKRIDPLSGTANYRVPDFLDEKNLRIIADSKNVKKREPSDQLLDFALYAQKHGLAYRIYVRENTVISPAMREFATNNGIRVFRSLPPGQLAVLAGYGRKFRRRTPTVGATRINQQSVNRPQDQSMSALPPTSSDSVCGAGSSNVDHWRACVDLERYLPNDLPKLKDGLTDTTLYVPRSIDEVNNVLRALEDIDHSLISRLVQGWLLDWDKQYDARPIAKVWDDPNRKVNRWALADALSKGKGEGIDDWLAGKLLNTNGEHEHQRLCEAAARRLKTDLARKCLYRAFTFMPGHAATGFGICGTMEDVEFLEKVLRDPGFLADVPKAVRRWQVKEIEKAVRRIRRRLS